jgi:hypothetical protein
MMPAGKKPQQKPTRSGQKGVFSRSVAAVWPGYIKYVHVCEKSQHNATPAKYYRHRLATTTLKELVNGRQAMKEKNNMYILNLIPEAWSMDSPGLLCLETIPGCFCGVNQCSSGGTFNDSSSPACCAVFNHYFINIWRLIDVLPLFSNLIIIVIVLSGS